MLNLLIKNNRTQIVGQFHSNPSVSNNFHEALRKELSYLVPGADWSPKFKEGLWDGRISLYNKRQQTFPTGLTPRVVKLFKELEVDYNIQDSRPKPPKNYALTYDFGTKAPRFYQEQGAELATKYTRAMLDIGTGGGKTMLSCMMLSKMSVSPVIFIVPSLSLLKQTQEEFTKYLRLEGKQVHIGFGGDGKCDLNPNGINVITYQTALAAFSQKFTERGYKLEVDEFAGETIRKSTEQLEQEFKDAEKAYKAAQKKADIEVAWYQEFIDDLSERFKNVKEGTKEYNKLMAEETKAKTKRDKQLKPLIKQERETFVKSRDALAARNKSLDNKKQIRDLFEKCVGLIVDEAHLAAVVIEALGDHAPNAYYRVGLSATPWREDNQEIRMEGALGRKVISVSSSDLIEMGFLVPPKIFMVKIDHIESSENYKEVYDKHITHCWPRNYRIKQFAEEFKEAGRPVIILVERREHGYLLEEMIKDAVFVPGGDKGEDDPDDAEKDYRRRMLNKTENNEIILIATQWANTGIDAPAISTLILAGSGQSSVTTYQQIGRVLRCIGKDIEESIRNGKPEAIIIDFLDEEKSLRSHSNCRKRVYKRERAWECKIIQ